MSQLTSQQCTAAAALFFSVIIVNYCVGWVLTSLDLGNTQSIKTRQSLNVGLGSRQDPDKVAWRPKPISTTTTLMLFNPVY